MTNKFGVKFEYTIDVPVWESLKKRIEDGAEISDEDMANVKAVALDTMRRLQAKKFLGYIVYTEDECGDTPSEACGMGHYHPDVICFDVNNEGFVMLYNSEEKIVAAYRGDVVKYIHRIISSAKD